VDIVDYPHDAVQFFAAAEAAHVDKRVRIIPIREEQLKERLGDRFRELDVPLLVEWPDGHREAVLLVQKESRTPPTSRSSAWPTTAWTSRSCSIPTGWSRWPSSCAKASAPRS
jgi:hypothetical protein